ncbi:MAG: hypothetical protein HZB24_14065, partial [Desulfobacterales bacterium]|nr:hypothetical protein [Desulfobacterales bacterium]
MQTPSRTRYALLLLILFIFIPAARAATDTDASAAALELQSALENALVSHRDELSDLRLRLEQLERYKGNLLNEIGAQEHKGASNSQLLLMSQPPLETLEQAILGNRLGYENLSEELEKLQARYNAASILFRNAGDRIALARKQMDDIPKSRLPDDQKAVLAAKAEQLIGILGEKKTLGENYQKIYDDLADRMTAMIKEKKALDEKLVAEFQSRKKNLLFTTSNSYRHIFDNGIADACSYFGDRVGALFGLLTEVLQWNQIKRSQMNAGVVFLFWLFSILALQARLRAFLHRVETTHEADDFRFRRLGLFLLRRSLLYLGMTPLFGVYDTFEWP